MTSVKLRLKIDSIEKREPENVLVFEFLKTVLRKKIHD